MICVLNGPSSSGKSTLARAIKARADLPCAVVSIDDYLKFVPGKSVYEEDVFEINSLIIARAAELAREFPFVIIDHVITSARIFDALKTALDGEDVLWARVACPLAELERRERERGDRTFGTAKSSYDYIYMGIGEHIIVDTAARTPTENAEYVIKCLEKKFE